MTESALELEKVGKAYGGLRVCDDVDLSVRTGELHALIGPNGAGKTTLLDLISGLLPLDQGRIRFCGRDITRKPLHKRARLGLARSFQITSLFPGFTVRQTVELAVQAGEDKGLFASWRRADGDECLQGPAHRIMERVGLADRADIRAENLAHGEQRLLEMAMALATGASFLLLDEPMAGMGPGSARELSRLIETLKGKTTILLVEHDMEAVFALADRISVLVQGRVIATGTPGEIRANDEVQAAYLGSKCWI